MAIEKNFTEEFNLGFGYPRSDICEVCNLLHISIQAAKSEPERVHYQEQIACHQELASQGYRSLRSDADSSKRSDKHLVNTFDLMQNLSTPT